jgi:WD40 repeat protein
VDAVFATALSPDGEIVAFGDGHGRVSLSWLANSHTRHVGSHSDRITALASFPTGQLVASGGWDGTIRLWMKDGREAATITTPERDAYPAMEGELTHHLKPSWWVNGLCFSRSGELLAVAGGQSN